MPSCCLTRPSETPRYFPALLMPHKLHGQLRDISPLGLLSRTIGLLTQTVLHLAALGCPKALSHMVCMTLLYDYSCFLCPHNPNHQKNNPSQLVSFCVIYCFFL